MRNAERFGRMTGWLMWTMVIVVTVWPWRSMTDHTHWAKVAWIPFMSPPVKITDVVGNMLLYVPFGLCGSRTLGRSALRDGLIVLAAMALSVGTEAAQLYSHWRFPSATDVVCNVLGSMAGIAVSVRLRKRDNPGAPALATTSIDE